MAVSSSASRTTAAPPAARATAQRALARPLATLRLDGWIVAASAWFVGGLYLDGWAHNTFPSLETFFTPWHAVLYSGFLASVAVLGWAIGRHHSGGRTWWQSIPAGYEVSMLGAVLFIASGVADMLWHIVFGIEANVDALLSPTHLALLLGGTLFVTGPIRAEARRRAAGVAASGWAALMPRLLALMYVLASLSFFTQYANPWGGPWASAVYQPVTSDVLTVGGRALDAVFLLQALSVAGVLLQAALLAAFVLVAVRPGRVPAGGFTLTIGLYVILTVLMRQKYDVGIQVPLALAGILTGVAADLLNAWLRPGRSTAAALRTFGALVPAVATGASILALSTTQGVWWTIHLWAGAVILAAATGWLLAYLATSTPVPVAEPMAP